jgi:hypothetical protein
MQEQQTLQDERAGAQAKASVQAPALGRLKEFRNNRIILGAVAGLGLVIASVLGIQALTGEESDSQAQQLASVQLVEEDPPLPAGWVDPYFDRPVSIPVEQDPPLPEGWTDPYFERPVVIPAEDPPLPAGWVDPYFQGQD